MSDVKKQISSILIEYPGGGQEEADIALSWADFSSSVSEDTGKREETGERATQKDN